MSVDSTGIPGYNDSKVICLLRMARISPAGTQKEATSEYRNQQCSECMMTFGVSFPYGSV